MSGWVLGIDIGGTGSRVAVRQVGSSSRREFSGEIVRVSRGGTTAPEVASDLIRAAVIEWPEEFRELDGIALGASGLASLVDQPALIPGELYRVAMQHGAPSDVKCVAAIDAVTSHLGALSGRPGVVTALGTGAISLGSNGDMAWCRVDGWGHLLGDRGGGAWIGLRALDLALQAHDGVDDAGANMLGAATAIFGPPEGWPAQLYTRDDRAAVLASFVPDVVRVARSGDTAAAALFEAAGVEAAKSAVAARIPGLPKRFALIGGLAGAVPELRAAFNATVRARCGDAEIVETGEDSLAGALLLAEKASRSQVTTRAPFIWMGNDDV